MESQFEDYNVSLSRLGCKEWSEIISGFRDVSIYQTWEYGSVMWGEENLIHCIIRNNSEIVAAFQGRLVKLPLLKNKMIYVFRGPIWKLVHKDSENIIFPVCLDLLSKHLVKKQNYFLKLVPGDFNLLNSNVKEALLQNGFILNKAKKIYHTIFLDMTQSLDELRKRFHKKWRYELKQTERQSISLEAGTSSELFDTFIEMYNEMYMRKQFVKFVDVNKFQMINEMLPENNKMHILIAKKNSTPVAGVIYDITGYHAIYLFAATTSIGRQMNASYLLCWKMLENLKETNCRTLDLGGINPKRFPGGYHFKKGMGGEEILHVGEYDKFNFNIFSIIFIISHRVLILLQSYRYQINKLLQLKRKSEK